MEQWADQGLVLRARPHGEGGAVLSVLTCDHGRHAGYLRGAHSSRMRGVIEPGNLVHVRWSSRVEGQLGAWQVEADRPLSAPLLGDPYKLSALLSACALCDSALPEREGHPGLFHGLQALLESMDSDVWGPAYVVWEIALLRELGFGLDFSRCAAGGPADTLEWISPKSGRAVSREKGEPYQDKLLPLPDFLKPGGGADAGVEEVLKGLRLTAHFLEHWVFAQHSHGMPPERIQFQDRMERLAGAQAA